MGKRSRSGRLPTRSEKILAIIGLIIIVSMVLSALAIDFGNPPPLPATTVIPVTFININPTPPVATRTPAGPASPTPGQAPAPSTP
ncbi:MAG TPA: hypothetical protein VI547_11015 [Anaerolineales bacterium]|nr:hypothetical protein [Anaerolineales bacterium]